MNQLIPSFQAAVAKKTPEAQAAYFAEFRDFMAERSSLQDVTAGNESWGISLGSSMLLATVLPPADQLRHSERTEMLEATALAMNGIEGQSGRKAVRGGLRGIEKFLYRVNAFRPSPLNLAFQDRGMPVNWATYDRARELRLNHTAQLTHKPLGQLATERFDALVIQAMPESLNSSMLSYLAQDHALDARYSLEGS